jgi:hypothetical protein
MCTKQWSGRHALLPYLLALATESKTSTIFFQWSIITTDGLRFHGNDVDVVVIKQTNPMV